MSNEKRLIDANALFDELIKRQYSEQTMGIVASYYPQMRAIVANTPTVDAVEVVHGYVLPAEEPKKVLLDMKCGICDQLMLSTDAYCPMCGAKMDRGNEDGK